MSIYTGVVAFIFILGLGMNIKNGESKASWVAVAMLTPIFGRVLGWW